MMRPLNILMLCAFLFAMPLSARQLATKFPIVFVHGLLGFDTMLGAVDYWNGIPDALRARGVDVYVVCVSKLESTHVRGEQLIAQIRDILRESGASKVNLIGHSHGGLDARYVAAEYPDAVASVTTVGTPNHGALVADAIIDNDGLFSASTTTLLNAFGSILALLSGDTRPDQDAEASLRSFTTNTIAYFNALYPQGLPREECGEGDPVENGIRYYSWGGVEVRTSWLDFTDYFFSLTALADDRPSDGLVERCSSHLGKVIRDDYRHNHVDLINGMWGLVGSDDVNPIDIYLEHAQRLRNDGV